MSILIGFLGFIYGMLMYNNSAEQAKVILIAVAVGLVADIIIFSVCAYLEKLEAKKRRQRRRQRQLQRQRQGE